MNRYVFGFLAAVGLIVLVIVLIVRSLVSGPSDSQKQADLTSYVGTGTTVQYTIDSPVASDSAHRDIIINIGNYQATITVTQGYQGDVMQKQSYPMSTTSYDIFLRALSFNGFTQGDSNPANKDERGQCALGTRYVFQVIDANGSDIQRFWYTSCGNGTFQGNASTIRNLFTKQIPDYSKITSGVSTY
jgi:hypothetical protein